MPHLRMMSALVKRCSILLVAVGGHDDGQGPTNVVVQCLRWVSTEHHKWHQEEKLQELHWTDVDVVITQCWGIEQVLDSVRCQLFEEVSLLSR